MRNVNLYGDDGISIMLDRYDDITADQAEAVVEITGHSVYFCSLEEAHAFIRAEYLESRLCFKTPTLFDKGE
jgi:YHS domain-containing protein